MQEFIQRHRGKITGILSGFDRVRLRGTKRLLAVVGGMLCYLRSRDILLKDFGHHVQEVTAIVRQATEDLVQGAGRPYRYLESAKTRKEDVARAIAQEDGITSGLIAVLGCVEPCRTFDLQRDRQSRQLEPVMRMRKCLHYYHYFIHPVFGFMHARLQTWYPFTMHLCLNGREWLVRQLEQRGIGYTRRENCLVAVDDVSQAQRLLDLQLRTQWPKTLEAIAETVNPVEGTFLGPRPVPYYWSAEETEWATDILFRTPADLAGLYPHLVRFGMERFGSREVLRFLGKRVPAAGGVRANFHGEVTTDLTERPEGVRIKHRVNRNSVKMYDKQGRVLRVETTINDAHDLKVYRAKEGEPKGKKTWRRMRKGVADLARRAALSQAANERYLAALASAEHGEPLKTVAAPVCRRARYQGRTVRAMNPLADEDRRLIEVIGRGEFVANGFRNRDLRPALFGADPEDRREVRRRAAKVTRLLRLLRAHGLVRKVPKSHRYLLTDRGTITVTALRAAQEADTKRLLAAA